MYGQIHCVIRDLVLSKFGEETWRIVLEKSQLDEHNSFLMFKRFDDSCTFSLVGAVSDTLGVPVETVLEIFGEYFFDYCLRHGYDKMLRTLGSDIKSFIQNLDSLHSLLALSYKGISAPSFRCEDGEDGELILHYYSGRPGLHPIVKGVLKAVARDLFHQTLEMSIIEQNREDIGFNQSQEHTAFRVRLDLNQRPEVDSTMTNSLRVQLSWGDGSASPCSERLSPDGSSCEERGLVEFNPDTVLLRASDFCSAFPYHIIFDRDLRIRQCGDLIQKHSSVKVVEGMALTQAFSIVHPKMVLSIDNIRKFINAVFLLAIVPGDNGKKTLLLKGQMIWIADTQNMIFIGSPRLTSLNELMEMNVYLADIPLYDVTRELVLLNQQRIAEIDIAKRLDETTTELKMTSKALEEEKCKTETLLHQMLPRKVADALTHGQKVEAEKFDQVTILFSDIVTFTNIASACSPMDIVNMLNDLYQRFDERTSQHNVYKVETIGDAYMIVSGVPEQTTIHAQPVANFAIDMVEEAGMVKSPATGLPLQIRVGVHTGPVVAGVVGVKMPRYCLFGDTVNTASRMESHGVPGRIHVSPTTYQALRGWGYSFKHRGEMEVKGKGTMSTYFLCGHLKKRLRDPEDEYTELEIHQDDNEQGQMVEWLVSSHEARGQNTPSPSSSSLNLSEKMGDDKTIRPTFYASSDSGDSSDDTEQADGLNKVVSRKESASVETAPRSLQRIVEQQTGKKYFRSDSTQSTGGKRLARKKKLSRSSLDDASSGESRVEVENDTKIIILPSSTKTSLDETNSSSDCVYVNGSFKNTYGPRRSPSHQNRTSVELAVVDPGATFEPGGSVEDDALPTKPPMAEERNPFRVASDHDELESIFASSMDAPATRTEHSRLTPDITEAHSVLLVSSSHSAFSCRSIIAKSETFPVSSSSPSKWTPSVSQNDLKRISRETRGKKKKRKESSKLCTIA